MNDFASILNVLQHGDSFFPSGSVSFSWGLEAMAGSGALATSDDVQAFIIGQLHARWACFDRTVVACAHRAAENLDAVVEIDELVELMTSAAELRAGSRRMGDAMLTVFARLGYAAAVNYRAMIKTQRACGHIAVMQGLLWAGAGLSEAESLALSAHTFCTGLLGAGLRLGCLTHIDAQRLLSAARSEASRIAAQPMVPLADISAYGIEAEIAVMRHASQDLRLFAN